MDGRGVYQTLHLAKDTADGYQLLAKEIFYFQWCDNLIKLQYSSGWSHTHVHVGISKWGLCP